MNRMPVSTALLFSIAAAFLLAASPSSAQGPVWTPAQLVLDNPLSLTHLGEEPGTRSRALPGKSPSGWFSAWAVGGGGEGSSPTLSPTVPAVPTETLPAPPHTQQTQPSIESLYLPLLNKQAPFVPAAPILDPISNPDGDGAYTITWSAATGAAAYLLQESQTQDFSSTSTAYAGTGTSASIFGKGPGKYYYRVRADSGSSSSAWSSIQSVDVVSQGSALRDGTWFGQTNQPENMFLTIPQSGDLVSVYVSLDWNGTCGFYNQTQARENIPIHEESFTSEPPLLQGLGVSGTFSSPTSASGTFTAKVRRASPLCEATMTGTWQAVRPDEGQSRTDALALQPDGKILLAGNFTLVQGEPPAYMIRLNTDGSLDAGFTPQVGEWINAIALQGDGKIIIAGFFDEAAGQPRKSIARLNPDGSLDMGFNPGAGGEVHSLAVQADGKILVGGEFTDLGGQPRSNLGRLESSGSVDAGFTADPGFLVFALEVQTDQKILVAGQLDAGPGEPRGRVIRLASTGSLDAGFSSPAFDERVLSLAVQADGKVVVGGIFNFAGSTRRNYIARLHPTGSLDEGFNPNLTGVSFPRVSSLVIQPDGKILAGGSFTRVGDQNAYRIARLSDGGSLDPGFSAGMSSTAIALALQTDGKVWAGGSFYMVNGQFRSGFARLASDGTLQP
jgi:uncharacterized delta-60 repeat protein